MLRPALKLKKFAKHVRSISSQRVSFKVLDGKLGYDEETSKQARERGLLASTVLETLLIKAQNIGGKKAIHRHTVVHKKLLVRDRLKLLFDADAPFLEIGALAGFCMDYGDVTGSVAGIGKIHERYCLVMANDATIKGGTLFPITVQKHVRVQHLSLLNQLPCIYLVDSGGAFLPLQADIFPDKNHGGRGFYNEAVLSSKGIPQLALVCGSCTAGGAYCPMMAEEAIMVDGMAKIFLGGPALVRAATGEVVTEQELGGAQLHCSVSGCTDYFAETEEEAFSMCRESILSLNIPRPVAPSNLYQEPLFPSNELDIISGKLYLLKDDLYKIIARISDGSTFKEFKKNFGKNLVVGFAFVCGRLIGVLGNCSNLTWQDAQKGTHFIQLCDQRHIPLVFLQNSGQPGDRDPLLDGLELKERAKMVAAHSAARVPKITINIGGCFADENFSMCGLSFEPNFMLSWPLAHASAHWVPLEERLPLDNSMEESSYTKFFDNETSAFYRASRMLVDGIIQPRDTRKTLTICLDIVTNQTSHEAVKPEYSMSMMRM